MACRNHSPRPGLDTKTGRWYKGAQSNSDAHRGPETEMYLAHVENGMKRAYAQRDWGRLEKALGEMWEQLKDVVK